MNGDGLEDLWALVSPVGLRCYDGRTGVVLLDLPVGGRSVAGRVDTNGDGVPDALVHNGNRISIRSGIDGSELLGILDAASPNNFTPQWVDGLYDADGDGRDDLVTARGIYSGSTGARLVSFPLQGALPAPGVVRVGDVNRDGTEDVLLAGMKGLGFTTRPTRLHSGADGSVLSTINWPRPPGSITATTLAAGGGETLVDGIPELLVAFGADARTTLWSRTARHPNPPLEVADTVGGPPSFGAAVATTPSYRPAAPVATLIGAPDTPSGGIVVLSSRDPINHVVGPNVAGARFGAAVCWMGDLDGNGTDDFAVGAPGADFVSIYATDATGGPPVELRRVSSPFAGGPGSFGFSIARVHDWNGDGIDELLVGAPEVPDLVGISTGSLAVISATDGSLLHRVDPQFGLQELGYSVAGLEDVDGDGKGDLLAGAPGEGDGSALLIESASRNPRQVPFWASGLSPGNAPARFGSGACAIPAFLRNGGTDFAVAAPDWTTGAMSGFVAVFDAPFRGLLNTFLATQRAGMAIANGGHLLGSPTLLISQGDGSHASIVFAWTPDILGNGRVVPVTLPTTGVVTSLAASADRNGDGYDDVVAGIATPDGTGIHLATIHTRTTPSLGHARTFGRPCDLVFANFQPRIRTGPIPRAGQPLEIAVDAMPPTALAALNLGFALQPIDLGLIGMFGCAAYVPAALSVPGDGSRSLTLPIPANAAGVGLYAQWAALVTPLNFLVFSDGLEIRLE